MFVAIELPADARDAVVDVIDRLRAHNAYASWTPRENLHCTLSFLGDIADDRVAAVSEAVGDSVRDMVDFPTHLTDVGGFPSNAKPRVVWIGLDDGAGGIAALADAVRSSLVPLGFEAEHRRFRAHVTLARLRDPRACDLSVAVEPVRFLVDRVVLFESRLGRPHAVHAPVATFPFRRAPAPPRPDRDDPPDLPGRDFSPPEV
ncbi:MAG: RNA 2',3'-cyclic phosphodiesterase [Actinomycetota bacterium]